MIHSTDYSPIKRTDLALRAFAAAGSPNGTPPRLLVTSTREDPRAQRELADLARSLSVADRVEFLGFLPYEDLPRYYSLADVLLQTGTAAGLGRHDDVAAREGGARLRHGGRALARRRTRTSWTASAATW